MIDAVLEVEINKPFGNLFRQTTVLVAVKDNLGRFIFGCKQGYYPDAITRLMGGGVSEGETPVDTAIREMKEEMGIEVEASKLVPLGKVKTIAKTPERTFEMTIYLFYIFLGERILTPGDDVTHFMYLDEMGFENLIRNYKNIPTDLMRTADGEDFYWTDFGKVYGETHKLVLGELQTRGILKEPM